MVDFCAFRFGHFSTPRFMSLAQSPGVVLRAWTGVISVGHLEDVWIRCILLFFPLRERVKAGEVV